MEVFTEMDVTQSYEVTTREYGGKETNNINSMTDEQDLLEVYRGRNPVTGEETDAFSISEINEMTGKVLEHDEMYDDLVAQAQDISNEWLTNINGSAARNINAMEDSTALASNELLDLEVALKKSDPAKYGDMSAREILQKVKNIDNDNTFGSDVDEAVMRIAEDNYDQSPMFQWQLNEGVYDYTITGNEDYGYTTQIFNHDGANDTLDVVYSANEAMVQVEAHAGTFGGAINSSNTKWHSMITDEGKENIETYKETVVTADSPSGDIFEGEKIHFPEDNQVFHLRTTERNGDTLFIEELQSDWNNEISKKGIKSKVSPDGIPQSPLPKDKWINVGLRKAIAMAIENGQTRVEWTTSAQQVDQWSKGEIDKVTGIQGDEFEQMYIKLYDEKLNGIAKRISNKYKSTSGSHYIEINDAMIAHHKSGKGQKLMATAPAIPAAQVANDKEDNS
tara:strand:- start:42 stop:1391 length:1350 start_codon:yes stop_codon:yes gene_type:complete